MIKFKTVREVYEKYSRVDFLPSYDLLFPGPDITYMDRDIRGQRIACTLKGKIYLGKLTGWCKYDNAKDVMPTVVEILFKNFNKSYVSMEALIYYPFTCYHSPLTEDTPKDDSWAID